MPPALTDQRQIEYAVLCVAGQRPFRGNRLRDLRIPHLVLQRQEQKEKMPQKRTTIPRAGSPGSGPHHAARCTRHTTPPQPTYHAAINTCPPPSSALHYPVKGPNFPKNWAFARRISCVYTHGMRRAGTRHANGAVMDTITATPPASCTACHYSPTTTTLGKNKSPPPPYSALLYRAKMPIFPKIWAFARRISCVYTHGMQRAGARHANGAVMATITATPPATRLSLHPPTITPRI